MSGFQVHGDVQLLGLHSLLQKRHVTKMCRPLINKPPPFKGLGIRIPIIISIKGRGFVNQGCGIIANLLEVRTGQEIAGLCLNPYTMYAIV